MSVWSFAGKRVVIAGCASGMGEAAARELVRLGAELHGFDIRPSPVEMASFHALDLSKPESIATAAASLDGEIDVLFNCAGLPQTFPAEAVMRVNFIGLRLWTETWLPRIRKGGSVSSITSTAGFAWSQHLPQIIELLATPDFASAETWVAANPELVGDGYGFSKEVATVWTMMMGARTIKQGVRINCICPGPTQTPRMGDFEEVAGASLIDVFTLPIARRSTPAEQAYPLIFLGSDAASYINGHALNVDGGFVGAVATGQIDLQAELGKVMGAS